MNSSSGILIIGGGVIGAACANELAQRGAKVTLIDKGEIGYGCSYGNAGWVSLSFAMPLPMPGLFWKSIGWMLDPEGPLHIQPRMSWELVSWLMRFTFSMNKTHFIEATKALTDLAQYSLEEYRKFEAERPGSFGFQQPGRIVLSYSDEGYETVRTQQAALAKRGLKGRMLTPAEVKEMEPSVTGAITGGAFYTDEAHMEPYPTVKMLAERAQKHGATVLPRTEVFEFIREGNHIEGVRTTHGVMRADQYVLATGSWSTVIGRSLGLHIPVLAGKGYAIIIDPVTPTLRIPLMIAEKKVGLTPCPEGVRLVGTMEIVDSRDESITAHRVQSILNGARNIVSIPREPKIHEVWRGLRPCTSDGVPIIGRPAMINNLIVATGHQMIGLMTAPATGRLVADIASGASPKFDLHPFRATRF